ncbi:MAG: PPC domain-containing protein [Bradymonadales bacterium]|nr:PPC domain-containing protein [Bradymonadales bacterium]
MKGTKELVGLLVIGSLLLAGCAEISLTDQEQLDEEWVDFYGIEGPFETSAPLGKTASTTGPARAWANTDTVWTVQHEWTDVTAEAGIAWSANSGLNWEQKYSAWVQSLQTTTREAGGTTFEITTPDGRTLPAPLLECAEVAIFLRVTFASWYGLPFYLRSSQKVNGQWRPIYLGHFGFRNYDGSRFSSSPTFRNYKDYTGTWNGTGAFPSNSALARQGLYGGGDEVPFLPQVNGQPARAGAYFDTLFLNKRVGHFLIMALSWFGSMHLADENNTSHIAPEATRAGDVLIERWQRSGIGHTIPVMRVTHPMEGRLEIDIATGSMPRRQPVWERGASVLWYFTSDYSGGPGTNEDGDRYASLGGGIRRWRSALRKGTMWVNNYMPEDRNIVIAASQVDTLAARTSRFRELLADVSPQELRDAALTRIQASREHLADHPASCSARERREEAFVTLYQVMEEHFGMSKVQVDSQYRTLADYVFAELVYNRSRSCCWNSTTRAMYEIVMAYAQAEQDAAMTNGECIQPTVFMGRNRGSTGDGWQLYRNYAQTIGRSADWLAWSADESCPQANVVNDTEKTHHWTGFCDLSQVNIEPTPGTSCEDGNDYRSSATRLTPGQLTGQICNQTDVDYYTFTLTSQQQVEVTLNFTHSSGDLDLQLQDHNGGNLATSQSTNNVEFVNPVLPAGQYFIRVYGYSGATGPFTLQLAVRSNTASTCSDAGNSFATARAIGAGTHQGLSICAGETDFWKYTAPSAGRVTVTIRFQHSRGDLDMSAWRDANNYFSISQSTADTETITFDTTAGQATVLKIYGYNGAAGDYDLTITQ